MKIHTRGLLHICLLTAISCLHPTAGPTPPSPTEVLEVRVEALPPKPLEAHVIHDRSRVDSLAQSYAVSSSGWVESGGRELLPQYRIDFIKRSGAQTTYWLGTNSHPPRFPCYSLCSGWWVAPSKAPGAIDPSRYKGLPSSVYFYFLSDLDIP